MANVTVGLIAHLVAKPGKEEVVADFLKRSLAHAQAESFTPVWFSFRAGPSLFYIVDAFPDATGPKLHLQGAIAAELIANAGEWLAEPPRIENLEVLGAKLP